MKGRIVMGQVKLPFYRCKRVILRENVEGFAQNTAASLLGEVFVEARGRSGMLKASVKNLRSDSGSTGEKIYYHLWLGGAPGSHIPSVCLGEIEVDAKGEGAIVWQFDTADINGYPLEMYQEVLLTSNFGPSAPQHHEMIPLKGTLGGPAHTAVKPAPLAIFPEACFQYPNLDTKEAEPMACIADKPATPAANFFNHTWRVDDEEEVELPVPDFDEDLYRAEIMDLEEDSGDEGNEDSLTRAPLVPGDLSEEDQRLLTGIEPGRELPEEDAYYEVKRLFKKKHK